MIEIKPILYTPVKKLICDWTNRKIHLTHYRTLKLFVKHGMIVDKVREIMLCKQSKWSVNYTSFNTQKRHQTVNVFENDFRKVPNNAFYGNTMENVRKREKMEFFGRDDNDGSNKQQSKPNFNGVLISNTNQDSYTFKQNEILTDKPIYLGFVVLQLSNILMYET